MVHTLPTTNFEAPVDDRARPDSFKLASPTDDILGREERLLLDFDGYRQMCDMSNSFRKTGILDRVAYDLALTDRTTVFCGIGRRVVPSFMRVEYEGGYDADRTKELTDSTTVMLSTLPVSFLEKEEINLGEFGGDTLPSEYSILIEQPSEQIAHEDRLRMRIADGLRSLGRKFMPKAFLDAPSKPGYQQAWIGMYTFSYGPSYDALVQLPSVSNFKEAWRDHRNSLNIPPEVTSSSNDTYMFSGQELKVNKALVDELWAISEIGFGRVLGRNHPVSMAETREFFEDRLLADGNYTVVRFVGGRPMCFGSVTEDLEECAWLNFESDAMKGELTDCEVNNETPLYFSEVISRGEAGGGYAMDIFNLIIDMTSRRKIPFRLFFESTNRSSRYIPRGVERAVRESKLIKFANESQGIELVDKLDYWFLQGEFVT